MSRKKLLKYILKVAENRLISGGMSSLIFRLGDAFPHPPAFGAHGQVIDWEMGFGSFLRTYRISASHIS